MIWVESLYMALQQIRANKMRSFLTVLGIVIGITTVVLIVSVLEGYKKNIENEFSKLGANTFTVKKYNESGVQVGPRDRNRKDLEVRYADLIKKHCPSVAHAAVYGYAFGQVRYKQKSTQPNVLVIGTNEDFPYAAGFNLAEGRFYSPFEAQNSRNVAVLGMDVAEKLFPHENAIGKKISLRNRKFTVIGIMEKAGDLNMGQSRDNRVFIPISTYRILFGKGLALELLIQAREGELMTQAQDEVIRLLRKIRFVPPGKPNDFWIVTSEGMMDSFNELASTVQMIASSVGLMSLLVGSIGVMAIMLVSVTERTREIGIRKAIGAGRGVILFQFLMEAVTLTAVGGILGIIIGIILSYAVSSAFNLASAVSIPAMIISFVVTVIIGVVSGLYPAYKAAGINPIDALRYE